MPLEHGQIMQSSDCLPGSRCHEILLNQQTGMAESNLE
jgi:hypothetical protein